MPVVSTPLHHNADLVASPSDLFRWPSRFVRWASLACQHHCGDPDRYARRLASCTLSTSFSGVCTPSCALEALSLASACDGNAATSDIGSNSEFNYLYAIERDPECLRELQTLPRRPSCLHGDITSFLAPGVIERCDALGAKPPWTDLARILFEDGAVRLYADCIMHGKACHLVRAWLHVAGCPCVDWSSLGSKSKCTGHTMRLFLIWCRHRILLGDRHIIIENVKDFDVNIVLTIFQSWYHVDCVMLDGSDFAMPVHRARRYIVLTHRSCVLSRAVEHIVGDLGRQRSPNFTYADLLTATDSELRLELSWSSNRALRRKRPHKQLPFGHPSAFECSLADWEFDNLVEYRNISPNHVYGLAQDPKSKFKSISGESTLQTVVKHCHIMWIDHLNRFMTGRELLAAQGFPSYISLARYMQPWLDDTDTPAALCSFNRSRAALGLAPRQRKRFGHMAGNAMCVPVVGAVMLWVLVYSECCEDSQIPVPNSLPLVGLTRSSVAAVSLDSRLRLLSDDESFVFAVKMSRGARALKRPVASVWSSSSSRGAPTSFSPVSTSASSESRLQLVQLSDQPDNSTKFAESIDHDFIVSAKRRKLRRLSGGDAS